MNSKLGKAKELIIKKMEDKMQEYKRILKIFILLIAARSGSLYSAWLDNVPGKIKQPDGVEVDIFWTGDEFYHWAHNEDYYTIIQDEKTGFWCWAERYLSGELISSGYKIHLTNPKSLGFSPNINISKRDNWFGLS